MYEGINLKTPFRDYQKDVLDRAACYMNDRKLHISAAPGSGKTILGLEFLRRLDKKALILVPTINLRNQWKERFLFNFVKDTADEQSKWNDSFSLDINNPGVITCTTYQALFSIYSREDSERSSFKELIELCKLEGIETVCLDEAHHLKREWWKALTEFLSEMNVNLISLTATPPMDTTDIEWKRYIDLCGEIDIEISIPEMVVKNCLCPHQDYLYICRPTDIEHEKILKEVNRNRDCMKQVLRDKKLYFEVMKLPFFKEPLDYADKLIRNPDYLGHLLSYISFIRENWQVEFEESREKADKAFDLWDKRIRESLDETGADSIENIKWFMPLMKDILENDPEDFTEELREELTGILTNNHLMIRGRLKDSLISEEADKTLRNSASKLSAILDIVKTETVSMGEKLRCLILMDYIRKEDMGKIETLETLTDLGVVPVFERLRRLEHLGNLETYMEPITDDNPMEKRAYRQRIGVLTGSMVILPKKVMQEMLDDHGISGEAKKLGSTDYLLYEGNDSKSDEITGIVTSLFEKGKIEILIGTAALLGEGWDAPSVNTVIIGSTSSMYVKTNQMRGRALRIDVNTPDKVANIWHLMTDARDIDGSSENASMRQRFDSIVGLSMDGMRVESGLGRMTAEGISMSDVSSWNQYMKEKSKERDFVRKCWENVAIRKGNILVRDVVDIPAKRYKVGLKDRFLRNSLSKGRFDVVAGALHKALVKAELIERKSSISKKLSSYGVSYYLESASERDSRLYARCLKQIVSPIESPKYMVGFGFFVKNYIAVPDVLALKKETAELFRKSVSKNAVMIYTLKDEGRKLLLRERLRQKTAGTESVKLIKKIIGT